jgi:hypothetical protein
MKGTWNPHFQRKANSEDIWEMSDKYFSRVRPAALTFSIDQAVREQRHPACLVKTNNLLTVEPLVSTVFG